MSNCIKKWIVSALFTAIYFVAFGQTNVFPSSGTVGIGTTNPDGDVGMHIKSTVKPLRITSYAYATRFDMDISGNKINTDHKLQLNPNTSNDINMCIGGGDVGINVIDPEAKLHLKDALGNGSTGAFKITSYGSYTELYNMTFDGNRINSDKDLYLNSISNKNVNIASGGGSVGIGTNSPSYKLDVDGVVGADEFVTNGQGKFFRHAPAGEGSHLHIHQGDNQKMLYTDSSQLVIGVDVECQKALDVMKCTDRLFIYGGGAYNDAGAATFSTSLCDAKINKNARIVTNSLERIQNVNLYDYNSRVSGKQLRGPIAHEVKEMYPESVSELGYDLSGGKKTKILTFNPNNLIYDGISATKELAEEVNSLKSQINELEEQLVAAKKKDVEQDELIQLLLRENGIDVKSRLSKTESSTIISQNQPNPFSRSTVIRLNIPEYANEAVLQIINGLGQLVKEYTITNNGEQQIQIYPNDLGNQTGVFTYSLFINQELISSKKLLFKE